MTMTVDAFLTKHPMVKALPENTNRILRLAGDKDCDMSQLLKLISQDAGLTGAMMKAANSAFYSFQSKVTRLDRAVSLMGLKTVKEVTLSSCLSSICKPVIFGNYQARDLWDHCVTVGILARELAVRSKKMDAEEAFLAGIMHDIGLLLALQSEPELARQLIAQAESKGGRFIQHENAIFGFDHCSLGEKLGQKWTLAPQLIAGMRWHHEPQSAPPENQAVARLIFIADVLACQSGVGFPITCSAQEISDEILEQSGLTREIVDEVNGKLPFLRRLMPA